MSRIKHVTLCAALLVLCSAPSIAQDSEDIDPYLKSKHHLDIGAFFFDRKITLRVDGTAPGIDSDIELSQQFRGKRDDEVFILNYVWRFGEKWSFRAQYFDSSFSQRATLTEDVEWEDVIFGAGTNATAAQDIFVVRAFFGREFQSGDRHEYGVGAGIHLIEVGASIEGTVIIQGAPDEFRRESVRVTGPVPNMGLWYQYSISPRWAFRVRFDWLDVSIGDIDGTLINAAAGLDYKISDHFGLGIGYNLFELDATINKSDWKGRAETKYEGVNAFISFLW